MKRVRRENPRIFVPESLRRLSCVRSTRRVAEHDQKRLGVLANLPIALRFQAVRGGIWGGRGGRRREGRGKGVRKGGGRTVSKT